MTTRRRSFLIILILGALSTVSPFSIDMYLPAFPEIARDLGTTPAKISLSVSGYFFGLALGQLFYGPLLDRFGRKPPLYAGMSLFVVASLGCIVAPTPDLFIACRLLQALGGCVASVTAVAMVRDFFPVEESAKILSLLILVLSVSPLFAPTIGGFVAGSAGWTWIFVILAGFALIVMALVAIVLPAGHRGDAEVSLRPAAIVAGFRAVLVEPQFYTYAVGGAFAFAGLFVYVTGSPIIFIATFHVDPHVYGLIFAALGASFIAGSQINIWLSRRLAGRKIFRAALVCQNLIALVLVVGAGCGWYGLPANIALLMLYLPFCGLAAPNASALALAPFSRNVGSASAMLGFLQMAIGAFASTGVGLLNVASILPIYAVIAATAAMALAILLANRTAIAERKSVV